MTDNIDDIKVKSIEVNHEKVVMKDVTLEDIEINFFGRIIKINKIEIDEIELDKFPILNA